MYVNSFDKIMGCWMMITENDGRSVLEEGETISS